MIFAFVRPFVTMFGCSGAALKFGIQYLRFMACVLVIITILLISRGRGEGT